MIRTDISSRVPVSEHTDLASHQTAANTVNHEVLAQQQQALSGKPLERRTASRMGEMNAGTNLLKSQLLGATTVKNVKEIAKDTVKNFSLSNGDIQTSMPANGNTNANHTIYINGIEEWPGLAVSQGQALANAMGVPVDTIYQHSTIGDVTIKELGTIVARVLAEGVFGGVGDTLSKLRADLVQKLQNPTAANRAADQIIAQLGTPNSSGQVHLVGYSQGAAISAEALKVVQQRLTSQYGEQTANQMLSRVHVMTLGGAAVRTEFPPQVELTQMYHKHDIVSQFFGDDHTPLWQDALYGGGLLPHLSYMTTDKTALDLIGKWQQGQISNQDIALKDVLRPV